MNTKEFKAARLLNFEGTQLSENTYNLVIGLVLLWGILINVAMAFFLTPVILQIHQGIILIVYLVVSFGCTFLIYKSDKPALSFLGFTGLAIAMGLLLTYFVSYYTSATVYQAFLLTAIVTVIMMLLATIFPAFFQKIGAALGIALLAAIAAELIGGLLFHMNTDIMNYAEVVIFSGFIGFDWARAQAYPKTLDNAIDSAADIYVDVVNIFIRILEIMGKKND